MSSNIINLILENLNSIIISSFGAGIFFSIIQWYYERNIIYIYTALGVIVGLFIFLKYSENITDTINNYILSSNVVTNENNSNLNTKYISIVSILSWNLLFHVIMFYLIVGQIILLLFNKIIKNNYQLLYIKNIFGEYIQKLIFKIIRYSFKSNNFFIIFGWVLLIITCLISLNLSNFMLNNIEIISEIVSNKS